MESVYNITTSYSKTKYCIVIIGQKSRADGSKICKQYKSHLPQPRYRDEFILFRDYFIQLKLPNNSGIYLDWKLDRKGRVNNLLKEFFT